MHIGCTAFRVHADTRNMTNYCPRQSYSRAVTSPFHLLPHSTVWIFYLVINTVLNFLNSKTQQIQFSAFLDIGTRVTATTSVVWATHICFCARAHPGTPACRILKSLGPGLAEYSKHEKKKTQLRSGVCFTTEKDKQQHVSLQFL